ncbi:MAG: DEAD/DEAH box helicase, partial [Parachlamydiaceae bacterium]|nr:DEAD/DEAH box helicase [Parachlamydiaceae bacterium]
MIALPKRLRKFQSRASKYLSAGYVHDIEFAGGTYQVLVFDPETDKKEWAFLQLDGKGKLKDSFCSCCESEAGHDCVHMAVALLYIIGGQDALLHIRFEGSLWNHLFLHCSENIGTNSDDLKKQGNARYIFRQPGGKIIFSVAALSPDAKTSLEKILFHRRRETEETSLKFSNLSPEEIALWRNGKPTPKLSYDLSFWNDLAKLVMSWQEEGQPYKITFGYAENKLPNYLKAEFSELELEFYLSEELLPQLIPTLATVNSPLVVHNTPCDEIEKIVYDQNKRCLEVIPKARIETLPEQAKGNGINLSDWTFVPGDGFYSRNRHFLLIEPELTNSVLEKALNEYAITIKSLIEGCIIHDTPVSLSYAMTFDSLWNLHICGYLFNSNDLSAGESYSLGGWAYLDNDGFYRLEEHYFEDLETIIPAGEVSDFITFHATWLNNQIGFTTHISHIEAEISYEVNLNHQLIFSRRLIEEQEGSGTKDFGRWVYVEGQGFFAKKSLQSNLPILAGRPISPDQIPAFIRENHTDLSLIKRFFIDKCPVVKAGLNIALNKKDQISITPEYHLLSEYQDKVLYFFDDFVYLSGEGFYELPIDQRLPERFKEPVIINSEQLPHFLQVELPALEPFVHNINPRLRIAAGGHLLASSIEQNASEGKADYSLQLKYTTEYGAVPVSSLWWSFKQKKRFVFSEAGLVDLSDKRFSWFKTLQKDKVDRRSNHIELTVLELMRLNASDEIVISPEKENQQSKELLDELKECRVSEEPDLTGLKSKLRPYQQKGVDWLWFLYRHGLSGLLCDDMGLGKTHQAMALLVAVTNFWRKKNDGKKRHFLIICPTSVIYHWQEKLSDFLPDLKIWTFYGAKRSLDSFYEDCDVLLTSYGVL